jgi:prepilin-type N-terminal cleavage/methylation domain-containing protein
MSLQQLKKKTEGFTIIEVLIVLAIAGLIMVIVFIAVPALQRSQRNEARNNDARLVGNAVNECLSNRNGQVASCSAIGANAVVAPANPSQLTTTPAVGNAGTLTQAQWQFNSTCDNSGNITGGTSARQFAVTYLVETSSGSTNRCISG